jgi:drug/metabolite transporter (DMT)-like permease
MEKRFVPAIIKPVNKNTMALVFVTIVFWSSAFAGIRVALFDFSPGHLALFRFLIASGVLAVFAVLKHVSLPNLRDIPKILFFGFFGVTIYHVALNFGEINVTAGAASLLIATTPVFTAVFAVVFLGEILNRWGWLGLGISLFGVMLVTLGEGGGFEFEVGSLLILIAALSTSVYFAFQKPFLKKYGTLGLTTYVIWAGTFFMLVFLPGLSEAILAAPLHSTLSIVYLGVFPGALAYVTWTQALSKASTSLVSSFLYLSPVFAIFMGWFLLQEIPNPISLIGGGISMLGVMLVNFYSR